MSEEAKTFLCSYNHADGEYSFEIKAPSLLDAQNHMWGLKRTARVDGELDEVIPASLLPVWKFWGWLRDLFTGRQ